MRKQTPWGATQDAYELAPGIISYSTASHGGIHLSAERQKELNYSDTWIPGGEWFEEDCDWSIPYAFFSQAIREHGTAYKIEENIQAAINTIKNHAPEFLPRLEGRLF